MLVIAVNPVRAIYDPRDVSNNPFGMHIIDENDLLDARALTNSSGGDWGYVKLVIREDDRKSQKWQEIFDNLRKLHLIPIVRLATKVEKGGWIKPRVEDIGSWVDFLNSLNWVTENRYVVIFNEPNHAKEWGGDINPEEYAWFLKEFSHRLKEKSPDFFILPAGLDASAPNSFETLDEQRFIERMVAKEPDVFTVIDGWSSHSYPNPGFVARPTAQGRSSVRTYSWERDLLAYYGIDHLPIFILETGWKHNDGKQIDRSLPTPQQVANYYEYAFTSVWNDPQIVAVVPFLLNYQDEPFDHFSWKKFDTNEFYPMYETVQKLPKTAGKPKQKVSATLQLLESPLKLVARSRYDVYVDIENTGQTLMSTDEGWIITLDGLPASFGYNISAIAETAPFHRHRVKVALKTPEQTGQFTVRISLTKDDLVIGQQEIQIALIAPPRLTINAKVWLNHPGEGNDFGFLIYDDAERLLDERTGVVFKDGIAEIADLYNIFPNQKYRLILTKPYYLPRQLVTPIGENKTEVTFPPLLPFDPSNDGQFSAADVGAFFMHPIQTVSRLLAL